jgi:hypothetical protein
MIHIVQCLCPDRHCVIAVAYDDAETSGEEAQRQLQALLKNAVDQRVLNPWCGICLSWDLYYEDSVTRFRTMEEAKPALAQCQTDQFASRALIDEAQRAPQN